MSQGGASSPDTRISAAFAVICAFKLCHSFAIAILKVTCGQVFSETLKNTLNAYHNRAVSTMQIIEELIKLATDLDAAPQGWRGDGSRG